jgi:hypothetical protein
MNTLILPPHLNSASTILLVIAHHALQKEKRSPSVEVDRHDSKEQNAPAIFYATLAFPSRLLDEALNICDNDAP